MAQSCIFVAAFIVSLGPIGGSHEPQRNVPSGREQVQAAQIITKQYSLETLMDAAIGKDETETLRLDVFNRVEELLRKNVSPQAWSVENGTARFIPFAAGNLAIIKHTARGTSGRRRIS